jgi:alkylated DNA repair dioxygenase AlkB
LYYWPQFIAERHALHLFAHLREDLVWEQSTVQVYGKRHRIPRLNAWYGEAGADYRYSGTSFTAKPWTEALLALRAQLHRELDCEFNSVLANYYRDGRDCMGFHADDEPELGAKPVIACLSLGASRPLRFRHKAGLAPSFNQTLLPGSLLVMAAGMQTHWQHALPKRAVAGPRISLTFRQVVTSADHNER